MSGTITSTRLEQTGELFLDSQCCVSAWVSAFSIEGFPRLSADCIVLISTILFKFSHSILDIVDLCVCVCVGREGGGGIF